MKTWIDRRKKLAYSVYFYFSVIVYSFFLVEKRIYIAISCLHFWNEREISAPFLPCCVIILGTKKTRGSITGCSLAPNFYVTSNVQPIRKLGSLTTLPPPLSCFPSLSLFLFSFLFITLFHTHIVLSLSEFPFAYIQIRISVSVLLTNFPYLTGVGPSTRPDPSSSMHFAGLR